VTFVAASGDDGAWNNPAPAHTTIGVNFPASDPNVLSVGGTVLTTDANGDYLGETAWSDSNGGYSQVFAEPSYQEGVQTPVHDQGLVVRAQHDVLRLEVAVEDAPAVRVGHRVAHRHQPVQQVAQGQRALGPVLAGPLGGVEGIEGVLEGRAADEPHGVAGRARAVGPPGVDRHDARMLQPAGDLGLLEEPTQALGVAGPAGLDELQGLLAIELGVAGEEDLAQPAGGVEAEVNIIGPRGGRLPARSTGGSGAGLA